MKKSFKKAMCLVMVCCQVFAFAAFADGLGAPPSEVHWPKSVLND